MVWLIATGVGLTVVCMVGVTMAVAARFLPAGRWREIVGFAPNCIVLLRRLHGDARLPGRARLAIGAALAYLLSPVQLIPNFVPVIGQTDDMVVVMAALRYTCRHLPRSDVMAAWPGDPAYVERLLGAARPSGGDPAPTAPRGKIKDPSADNPPDAGSSSPIQRAD